MLPLIKQTTTTLFLLIFTLLITIITGFQCSYITDNNLCLDTPGCSFTLSSCQGSIRIPNHCSSSECLFIDPSHKGQVQDGSILYPFVNITSAIDKVSQNVSQIVEIYGILRNQDDIFYIDTQIYPVDYLQVVKSFGIRPLQSNRRLNIHALLKFQHRLIEVNQDSVNANQPITIHIQSCNFLIYNKTSDESSLRYDFLTTLKNQTTLIYEDSYVKFNTPSQSMVQVGLFAILEFHLKFKNLNGNIEHVPFLDIDRPFPGTIQFIDCNFIGSIFKIRPAIAEDSFEMKNVTFSNMGFYLSSIAEKEYYMQLFSKQVKLESIKFSNITIIDHHSPLPIQTKFIGVLSQEFIIQNLILENSDLGSAQFISVRSQLLTAESVIISNIRTDNQIFQIEQTKASFNNSVFNGITNIKKTSKVNQNNDQLSEGSLCLNVTSHSQLRIQNCSFYNITSTCIYGDQSVFFIDKSRFSNQKLDKFAQYNGLDLSGQQVSWLKVQGTQNQVLISFTNFETNYLTANLGGAIQMLGGTVLHLRETNFTKLLARRGGAIYLKDVFYPAFYQLNFIENKAELTGGAIHADSLRASFISQSTSFVNCSSNYRGSILHITGNSKSSFLQFAWTKIAFSFEGSIQQFFINQYIEASFYFSDIQNNLGELKKSDEIVKFIKSSDDQLTGLEDFSFFNETFNDRAPLRNSSYITKLLQNLSEKNNAPNLKKIHSEIISLKGNSQQVKGYKIQTKNGMFLPVLIGFQVLDQYNNSIHQELTYDGFNLNFHDQQNSDNTTIQGQKSEYFKQLNTFINPQNIYSTKSLDEYQSTYKLQITQLDDPKGLLQYMNFKLNLSISIEFQNCSIGEVYVSATQICTPCSENLYSFSSPNEAVCSSCQENSECLGSNVLIPSKGYWRYEQQSTQSLRCPYPDDCLGGKQIQSAKIAVDFNGFCNFPSTGNLCNQCVEGYARASPQSQCVNCKTDVKGYLYFAFMFLFQIGIIISTCVSKVKQSIDKGRRQTKIENEKSIYSAEERKLINKNFSNMHYLSQLIRISFNYLETLRIIRHFSVEQLPIFFSVFLAGFSAASPTLDSGFSIDCLIESIDSNKANHFWIRYVAILLKPLIIFLFVLIIFLLYFIMEGVKKRRKNEIDEKVSLWKYAASNLVKYIATMIIVIIYFTQSHIIIASLDLFNCQNLLPSSKGTKSEYLFSDSNTQCWVGTHKAITLGIGVPVLIIFGIVFPVIAFVILRNQTKQKRMKQKIDGIKNLSEKIVFGQKLEFVLVEGSIKQDNYFWELLIIFRKNLFIITFVLLRNLDYLESLVVVLLFMMIFTFIHQSRSPYKFKNLNFIELIGYCSISILLMSLIILNGSKSNEKRIGLVFNIGFMIITIYFAFLSIPKMLQVLYKSYQSQKHVKQMEASKKNKQNPFNLVQISSTEGLDLKNYTSQNISQIQESKETNSPAKPSQTPEFSDPQEELVESRLKKRYQDIKLSQRQQSLSSIVTIDERSNEFNEENDQRQQIIESKDLRISFKNLEDNLRMSSQVQHRRCQDTISNPQDIMDQSGKVNLNKQGSSPEDTEKNQSLDSQDGQSEIEGKGLHNKQDGED